MFLSAYLRYFAFFFESYYYTQEVFILYNANLICLRDFVVFKLRCHVYSVECFIALRDCYCFLFINLSFRAVLSLVSLFDLIVKTNSAAQIARLESDHTRPVRPKRLQKNS